MRGLGGGGRLLLRVEAVHTRTELSVLVPQFPVGFGQTFETLALTPHDKERRTSQDEGRAGQQPKKGQQPWYVIERVATVSTA